MNNDRFTSFTYEEMKRIADNADIIVNGYAFTKIALGVQVVNLERSTACVFGLDDSVIETSMDDIELDIVTDYYNRNKRFIED